MPPVPRTVANPWRTIQRSLWLSIALGLMLEACALALQAGLVRLPEGTEILADTLQKVTWSALVCAGLAASAALGRDRARLGLAGLLSAPIAFAVAKALHQSMQKAAAANPAEAQQATLMLFATIKALQYGCLGFLLGWLGRHPPLFLRRYLLAGLGAGVVFGSAIVGLFVVRASTSPPAGVIVVRLVNEIVFPIGCCCVIWITQRAMLAHASDSTLLRDLQGSDSYLADAARRAETRTRDVAS